MRSSRNASSQPFQQKRPRQPRMSVNGERRAPAIEIVEPGADDLREAHELLPPPPPAEACSSVREMHATPAATAASMRRRELVMRQGEQRRMVSDVAPERGHRGMHEDAALDRRETVAAAAGHRSTRRRWTEQRHGTDNLLAPRSARTATNRRCPPEAAARDRRQRFVLRALDPNCACAVVRTVRSFTRRGTQPPSPAARLVRG